MPAAPDVIPPVPPAVVVVEAPALPSATSPVPVATTGAKGAAASGKPPPSAAATSANALVSELLGAGQPAIDVPPESYLVLRYGRTRMARAYLPGYRHALQMPWMTPALAAAPEDARLPAGAPEDAQLPAGAPEDAQLPAGAPEDALPPKQQAVGSEVRPASGGAELASRLPNAGETSGGETSGGEKGQSAPALQPARPPRRLELTLPDPLLADFSIVTTPSAGALGPAYGRIMLDAAERGGALVVVMDAQLPPGLAKLDFLATVAQRQVTPFFVVWTPAGPATKAGPIAEAGPATKAGPTGAGPAREAGGAGPAAELDPAEVMEAYRAAVATHAPRFAEAPWYRMTPGCGATELRAALVEWAHSARGRRTGTISAPPSEPAPGVLSRGSAGPTGSGGKLPAVPTAPDSHESGWEELLNQVTRAAAQSVRQRLAIELANIHLRCVQDIVFGSGCAGLPSTLDQELHALSVTGTYEIDAAITEILRQVLARVLTQPPYEPILARVAAALRRRLEEDGPELDRVMLITSTGGVAMVSGPGALGCLGAYETYAPDAGAGDRANTAVLPPLGIGLSASCYQLWRNEEKSDKDRARAWLQLAVRGTELELQRLLAERFDAVHLAVFSLVAEAVDHGLLLV